MKCPRCGERDLTRDGKASGGKQRWSCKRWEGTSNKYCYTTTDPKAAARDQGGHTLTDSKVTPTKFNRALKGVQRLIITAAQNGTPVHEGFLASLRTMAKELDAEIVVIPLRYKNPTSRWTQSQENAEVWAPELTPYLCNYRKRLNANLVLLGDVKVQPTASQPLMGFEGMTAGESGIIGHTKMQMQTIATPQGRFPKIMSTTGAVTMPNYTDSKAGKLGEFHHSLSALAVEISGKTFHMRQLHAESDTGQFYDLDDIYTPKGVKQAGGCEALIMGDTHVDFIDPKVERATFGEEGIVATLMPRHLIWHDLLDGYAANPHHFGNPFNAIAKRNTGRDNVEAEVKRALLFVQDNTPDGCKSVIVASNHDAFLKRWIISTDWRMDPTNAAFYLKCAAAMVDSTRMSTAGTEYSDPFAALAAEAMPNARVLGGRESFMLKGVELGMHGDRGPNGARGSRRNLRRIGVKSFIGHSHSPGIEEGCYQVGTSTGLDLEYNSGPSSWLNTHGVVYANGKRALINIIDGKWRL